MSYKIYQIFVFYKKNLIFTAIHIFLFSYNLIKIIIFYFIFIQESPLFELRSKSVSSKINIKIIITKIKKKIVYAFIYEYSQFILSYISICKTQEIVDAAADRSSRAAVASVSLGSICKHLLVWEASVSLGSICKFGKHL